MECLKWNSELMFTESGREIPVRVQRCFPWSNPLEFLSLIDRDGREVRLIQSVDELGANERAALMNELLESGFIFEITAIHAIEEEYELRNWQVTTRQGPRAFQTKLLDWPRELPEGGLLVQDVHGDLYLIKDPGTLPEPGRTLLWAFVD